MSKKAVMAMRYAEDEKMTQESDDYQYRYDGFEAGWDALYNELGLAELLVLSEIKYPLITDNPGMILNNLIKLIKEANGNTSAAS